MPGNMPTPGYRAISKSCRLSQKNGVSPLLFMAAFGVVALDNKSYIMDEVEYSAGISNFYDSAFPDSTLLESFYGQYLLVFVAGANFLSDIFATCISDYTGAAFYYGPAATSNVPITNAADLTAANNFINPKDIDLVTGYNSLLARCDEPAIWSNLMNVRMIASLQNPTFVGQNLLGWNGNPSNPYNKVSQTFLIPPGYKYLVLLPVIGLWSNQALGASTYVYNASFRCSLNLAV